MGRRASMLEAPSNECMKAFGPVIVGGPLPPPAGAIANRTLRPKEPLRVGLHLESILMLSESDLTAWERLACD